MAERAMLGRLSRQLPRWMAHRKAAALRPPQEAGRRSYSVWEPDYLDALKPQQPVYELLDIQMKAYDFPSLSRYQSYVHKTANNMGLTVEDSWATPAQMLQVNKLKARSTIVEQTYKLNVYERNVQIYNFPCSLMAVFVTIIQASLPEGVSLGVHTHELEHDEIRYIPDLELIELKSQLQDMSATPKHKKK